MSSIIARLKPNRELIGLFREETRKIANSNSLSIMGHTKWENIQSEIIQNLVSSIPQRFKAVIKARGGNTTY